MSITLGSYNFQAITTHQVPMEGPWEYEPIEGIFYGVPGAVEITDAEHGRMIDIECRFQNYSTPLALKTAIEIIDSKKAVLTDATLTVALVVSSLPYLHCSFRGFERLGKAFYDASGTNGWMIEGILHFRQLKRTA